MEIRPGRWNRLVVLKDTDFGIYLDGGRDGEILMPKRYIPEGTKVGDQVNAFIYFDSEDRIIATTEHPLAISGECAYLLCKSVTKFGAFMDWGLSKDLFVPFKEQRMRMEEGKRYVVFVYFDENSGRLAGSAKLDQFMDLEPGNFKTGQQVDLMITGKTDLGYKAVINGTHTGILYANEVFEPIEIGQKTKGYIAKLREDGKIDLRLQPAGYKKMDEQSAKVMDVLQAAGGFLPLTDHSEPELIYSQFGMSKKLWKKAVGALFKQRLIEITDKGIRIIQGGD